MNGRPKTKKCFPFMRTSSGYVALAAVEERIRL